MLGDPLEAFRETTWHADATNRNTLPNDRVDDRDLNLYHRLVVAHGVNWN